MRAAGKFKEAAAEAEEMLRIEREWLGEDAIDVLYSLIWLADTYYDAEDWPKSEKYHRLALAWREKRQGHDYWETIDSRLSLEEFLRRVTFSEEQLALMHRAKDANNKVIQSHSEGRYADAVKYAQESVELNRELWGDGTRNYATASHNLGVMYSEMGDRGKAESLYRRELSILKKILGEKHPKYSICLRHLGQLYSEGGDYARAEPLLTDALNIIKEVEGDKHLDYRDCLNDLGLMYTDAGEFPQAKASLEQARDLTLAVVGKDDAIYARSLNNLAGLYQSVGDYPRAHSLLQRSLKIFERTLGSKHPSYVATLGVLADVYRDLGDLAHAEPLYRQALGIDKEIFGETHPSYARSVHRLGRFLASMGDYAGAKPLLQQALKIRKASIGENTPDYAGNLLDLAGLYVHTGDLDRAERLCRRVLEIDKDMLGEKHPAYAVALNSLALIYVYKHDYASAEPLYRRSMEVDRAAFGENHPNLAVTLGNLGELYRGMGDYSRAEKAYIDAIEMRKSVQGEGHPDNVINLVGLAATYFAQGSNSKGVEYLNRAFNDRKKYLDEQLPAFTQLEMLRYLDQLNSEFRIMLTPSSDAVKPESQLAWTLGRKALAFQTLCLVRQMQDARAAEPQIADKIDQLKGLRQQLVQMNMQPASGGAAEKLGAERSALFARIDALGREVQLQLQEQTGQSLEADASWAEVREHLPAGAALVEIVRHTPYDFKATGAEPRWKPARYIAFVCQGGPAKPVERIDLGPAADIDPLVADLTAQMQNVPRELASFASEESLESQWRGRAQELYAKLFAPIVASLGDARMVYLSPDGDLHQIPFEALVDANGNYLVEDGYQFSYLTSGRDLLRPEYPLGTGSVVFAAPDYNLPLSRRVELAHKPAIAPPKTADPKPEDDTLLAASSPLTTRSIDVRGMSWKDLPGAREEGGELIKQLQTSNFGPATSFVGENASEEAFKGACRQATKPRLLAAITHGYFLADLPADFSNVETRGAAGTGARLGLLRSQEDPMLRSGLVMAGANQLDDVADEDKADDGWLTAAEIADLDLRGTDLVVLSACNSASGKAENGQAVAGLRTAILLAGANTIIGSLFPAPDEDTRLLMHDFYAGLLAGKGKLASLQQARLDMIARRRQAGGSAHPFFWAGFVLVGRP